MKTFENGDRLDILVRLVENSRRLGGPYRVSMPTDIARYSIELFKPGGEGAGIEEILDRHADLKIARSIYRTRVEEYPGRLIMLCDHVRVLARSDQPEPPTRKYVAELAPHGLFDASRSYSSTVSICKLAIIFVHVFIRYGRRRSLTLGP